MSSAKDTSLRVGIFYGGHIINSSFLPLPAFALHCVKVRPVGRAGSLSEVEEGAPTRGGVGRRYRSRTSARVLQRPVHSLKNNPLLSAG